MDGLTTRPSRVLIADDDAATVDSLRWLVKLEGFEARTAATGPDAIAIAADFQPDAILLDLSIPGMDGYKVADILKANPLTDHILLVAMTGWSGTDVEARIYGAGFHHYLPKPIDTAQLMEILTGGRHTQSA